MEYFKGVEEKKKAREEEAAKVKGKEKKGPGKEKSVRRNPVRIRVAEEYERSGRGWGGWVGERGKKWKGWW